MTPESLITTALRLERERLAFRELAECEGIDLRLKWALILGVETTVPVAPHDTSTTEAA